MDQEYIWATDSFGAVVKRAREAQQLTQMRLANSCELSAMHISHIEANERVPSMKVVVRIAENLGLDLPRLTRLALRVKYGDEIWDMISQEAGSEEREHKISPELKYIFWTVENLPEEKRKQTIRAMEELIKVALI